MIISEARMRALGHHWTTLALIVAVSATLTLGCRGSHPFGRFVKVTQEPNSDGPSIDAPQQRLAITKPRAGSAPSQPGAGAPGSSATSGRNPHAPSPTAPAGRLASSRSVGDVSTNGARPTAQTTTTTTKPSSKPTQPPQQRVAKQPTSKPANTADANLNAFVKSLEGLPIDQQRQQMRRYLAQRSGAADATDQPNSLDQAIAKNALNLPKLSEPKNETPDVPPTRIAAKDEPTEPATASLTDTVAETPAKESAEGPAAASLTDIATTDLEPSGVQTISDSVDEEETPVKPASASRDKDDTSMVARASVSSSPRGSTSMMSGTSTEHFQALVKHFSKAAPDESESDRMSRLITLRHLLVLSGDPDGAVEAVDGMAESEQEFLRHQLLGLWTMIDPEGHPVPSRRFTSALPQIREATKYAAAATDALEVRALSFCTEIESYGQIKTFSGNRFDAGQQVILYCEIENFTVKDATDGYETHLQGSYDIYNSDNEKVVSQLLPADQQTSSNYLRDYFIAYQMHLPQQLSEGTYRLQLTMEDVSGKKYGQASIPFEIAK